MNSLSNLYNLTYESQIHNFWNFLKTSIIEINNKTNNSFNEKQIDLLKKLIKNSNKEIRKISFLIICLQSYFENNRKYIIQTQDTYYENNLFCFNNLEKLNNKNLEIINKFNYSKNFTNDKEGIIWFFDKNNNLKFLNKNDIKILIVNEELENIFDPKNTISGIILSPSIDLSTNYSYSLKNKISSKNSIIKNKIHKVEKHKTMKTELKKLDEKNINKTKKNKDKNKIKSLIKIKNK